MKKMTKLLVLIALVFIVALSSCNKNTKSNGLTIKEGVFQVAMEIGYPPFEYFDTDGKTPIGFDVQMAKLIAEELGLKVEYVDTAWDGIFAGLNINKYDAVISAVTITDERLAVFNFTKPYIGNAQSLVLMKNTSLTAKHPEDLGGLRVAYQAETTSDIYMTKLKAEKNVNYKEFEYDKVMNCFDDLKNGRVDAIVCDSLVAIDYVADTNAPYEIVWLGEADEFFGVCIKKGNDELTQKIDLALDTLFAEGKVQSISKEIFGSDIVSATRENSTK